MGSFASEMHALSLDKQHQKGLMKEEMVEERSGALYTEVPKCLCDHQSLSATWQT